VYKKTLLINTSKHNTRKLLNYYCDEGQRWELCHGELQGRVQQLLDN